MSTKPIFPEFPQVRLATKEGETGECGICYQPDRLYTHGDHTINSAICEVCLRSLNPSRCPFCREPLGALSASNTKPSTNGEFIVILNTFSCKPFFFFPKKKEDRDPPGAGCGLSVAPISQNTNNAVLVQ